MAQGSWLGPLSFIVLIDDLMAGPTVYTTLCKSLSSTQVSDIDSHIKCLLFWTTLNSIKINYSMTKKCFWVHFQSFQNFLQSNVYASLNSLEFTLVMTCLGICSLA